jgi:hypothetical protein
MKTYGEVDVYIHVLFTSELVVDEGSDLRSGRFTPMQRAPVSPFPMTLDGPHSQPGRRGEDS